MSKLKSPPPKTRPTPKIKRPKAADGDVTDVIEKVEPGFSTDQDPTIARAMKIHASIVAKGKKARNDLTIAKLQVVGKHVYTADEICRLFKLERDPKWTQEHIQWVGEVGEHIRPILQLHARAEKINSQYVIPGRKAVRKLVEDAYGLFVKASDSDRHVDVFEQLRGRLASDGVTVHKDAPDASVIIRTIFEEFDSKQVHLYGRSLEYAKSQGIAPDKFSDFVSDEGGFEKIRTKALAESKKVDVQHEQARIESDEDRAREILEFRRTEPLIQLELTLDQHVQLKPNVTVSTPDKNMDMVILLAEMDPLDFKMCNVYGTVPMTLELRRAIEKSLGQHKIFDSAFATRFYAWKDSKTPDGPPKTAKERMADRVQATLKRVAKRDTAKQAKIDSDTKQ